jgi:hypothetical protein
MTEEECRSGFLHQLIRNNVLRKEIINIAKDNNDNVKVGIEQALASRGRHLDPADLNFLGKSLSVDHLEELGDMMVKHIPLRLFATLGYDPGYAYKIGWQRPTGPDPPPPPPDDQKEIPGFKAKMSQVLNFLIEEELVEGRDAKLQLLKRRGITLTSDEKNSLAEDISWEDLIPALVNMEKIASAGEILTDDIE